MNATTRAQLITRFRSQLPYALGQGTNAAVIADLIGGAWDNGWRDADWLLNSALIGTKHPAIKHPAALFVSQLRAAASEPCPDEKTPTPPPIEQVRAEQNRGYQPSSHPNDHIQTCRKALRGGNE